MKRHPLKEYLSRLLQQSWILVTGSVGFLITFLVGVFFPELNNRIVYVIIFGVALIVGGYSAFASLLKEYDELDLKFHELDKKKPNIVVGFNENSKLINMNLELNIKALGPKPDFDKWVNEKSETLYENSPTDLSLFGMARSIAALVNSEPNPHYKEEVERYLQEYREYLVNSYECGLDRAFELTIAVENKGNYPANNVSIELTMPRDYRVPKEHQQFDRKTILRKQIEYYVDKPFEPKPYLLILANISKL